MPWCSIMAISRARCARACRHPACSRRSSVKGGCWWTAASPKTCRSTSRARWAWTCSSSSTSAFRCSTARSSTRAPVISNQMLAILVRKNSDQQRATLTSRDIVIDPPLGEASSFDFGIVSKAIRSGLDAARAKTSQLAVAVRESRGVSDLHRTARGRPPRRADRGLRAHRAGQRALHGSPYGAVQGCRGQARGCRRSRQARHRVLRQRQSRSARLLARAGRRRSLRACALGASQFMGPELRTFRSQPAGRLRGQLHLQRCRAFRAERDHAARRRMGVGSAGRRNVSLCDRGLFAVLAERAVFHGAACADRIDATSPC